MADDVAQTAEGRSGQQSEIIVEPSEPKRDAIKETADQLRERLNKGGSIFDSDEPAEPDPQPEVEAEPEAPEAELEAEEAEELEVEESYELDLENLPEGFNLMASGRIQGPDGKIWSQEKVEAHANGEPLEAEGVEPQEGDEELEEPEEEDVYMVELPGRRPEDEAMEVPLAGLTEDEREAFNRMRNGYMRGEEARRQLDAVASQREELSELEADLQDLQVGLQTDPVGYITQHVPPEVRADLARHILSDDDVYEEVVEDLARWDRDENVRARRKAELKAERLERQEKAKEQRQRVRAARANAKEITSALSNAARDLGPQERDQFQRYALREIKEYANRQGADTVPVETVRRLLQDAGTLRLFGLEADALVPAQTPSSNGAGETSPEDPPVPTARPKGPAEERLVRKASTPDDGERFAEKASKKRSVTGSTPTGGPAPSTPAMKQGDTVKDRLELLKKRRKSGGSIQSIISGG